MKNGKQNKSGIVFIAILGVALLCAVLASQGFFDKTGINRTVSNVLPATTNTAKITNISLEPASYSEYPYGYQVSIQSNGCSFTAYTNGGNTVIKQGTYSQETWNELINLFSKYPFEEKTYNYADNGEMIYDETNGFMVLYDGDNRGWQHYNDPKNLDEIRAKFEDMAEIQH